MVNFKYYLITVNFGILLKIIVSREKILCIMIKVLNY